MKLFEFNPRNPISTFDLHIKGLQVCGLWSPENKTKKFLYEIYSWLLVVVFLYLFVVTQIIYLANAKNLEDFADALYFFLTELVTIPMHYYLKRYVNVANIAIERLESPKFISKDEIEDEFLSWAIVRTLFFHRPSVGLCFICIIQWSVSMFVPGSTKYSIVPAVFPFNFESGVGFVVVWVYQVIGAAYSAVLYATFDTLVTGVFFHATAQVNRLGYHLSKIGYEIDPLIRSKSKNHKKTNNIVMVKAASSSTNAALDDKQNKIRTQIVDCIEHYQEIKTYCDEFSSTFEVVIFIQLGVSLFVLCFTLFLIMNIANGDILASTNVLPYFVTITYQIWQLCYTGNELSHASDKLTDALYFANFTEFNGKNRKLMLLFMTRLKQEIKVTAKALFKIILDTTTFIGIMRASYSYFSVMKSVQGE